MVATAANDNEPGSGRSRPFPPDAVAIIEPVPYGVNQAASRSRAGMWQLRFAERSCPRPDPLTGWTGGGDPLAQIDLRFADLEAAERYCRRQRIRFDIRGSPDLPHPTAPRLSGDAPPRLCCWPTGPHARCCDNYPVDALREDQRQPTTSHMALGLAG